MKNTRRTGYAVAALAVASMLLGSSAPAWAVVSGRPAVQGEFPWVVEIERKCSSDPSGWCHAGTGTILSQNAVLTTASLVDGRNPSTIRVRAVLCRSEAVTPGNTSIAASYTVHDRFGVGSWTYPHDLSIVNLATPLQLTSTVSPALLPGDSSDYVGVPVTIVGWGSTGSMSGPMSNCLLKADTNVISTTEANYMGDHPVEVPGLTISDAQLPVYEPTETKTFCNGDVGSPVMAPSGGQTVVVGVESFGFKLAGQCVAYMPSVATRTSAYLPWIFGNAPSAPLGAEENDGLSISDQMVPSDASSSQPAEHRSVAPRSR